MDNAFPFLEKRCRLPHWVCKNVAHFLFVTVWLSRERKRSRKGARGVQRPLSAKSNRAEPMPAFDPAMGHSVSANEEAKELLDRAGCYWLLDRVFFLPLASAVAEMTRVYPA